MRRIIISLLFGLAGLTLLSGPGFSQTPPNSAAERRQALEENQAKKRQQMEEADARLAAAIKARNDKRKACLEQTKKQGLTMFNRRSAMKNCMAN